MNKQSFFVVIVLTIFISGYFITNPSIVKAGSMVTVVWETWLKKGSEDEGLALTRRIWADMTNFQGYVSHFILRDEDEKGHLLVISKWTSREAADSTREKYAKAEPVQLLTPLLAKPRSRWVLSQDSGTAQW